VYSGTKVLPVQRFIYAKHIAKLPCNMGFEIFWFPTPYSIGDGHHRHFGRTWCLDLLGRRWRHKISQIRRWP